ncbi:uncharacterized protein BP5553_09353 [Venustampulla echinocandica]|uniref:Uncharacterized protein n=1 Tax=Venustampulla echinocandica TaxID=2656787 RepID=A0A370TCJ6_9HELO|nr:uncharacterized protein BP5553_09353 [Venustampulla echinocandica]RDL31951.1 hypothetical protein BP5553_09353 [Venustampulla echinocandica]
MGDSDYWKCCQGDDDEIEDALCPWPVCLLFRLPSTFSSTKRVMNANCDLMFEQQCGKKNVLPQYLCERCGHWICGNCRIVKVNDSAKGNDSAEREKDKDKDKGKGNDHVKNQKDNRKGSDAAEGRKADGK